MKVLVLLFVALCCVAAINATTLDTKSIKKYDATIKVNVSAKKDKKNQKDSEGDEGEVENDCTCNDRENDKKVKKEKDQKIKEKKRNGSNGSDSNESGSNETKEKKVKKEKEQKAKENKRNGSDSNESGSNETKEKKVKKEKEQKVKEKERNGSDSNESGSNETKDRKGSRDNKNQKKNNGGRKGDSSEEDCSDSREGKVKKIRKDKNQGGNKPCGKPSQPTCNTVCTLIAAPLCASPDGCEGEPKTFDNECLLDVYNCQNPTAKYKKTSDGACKPVCPQACTFDLRPVCALPDGWCAEPQTFSNPCQLSVYNCENPANTYKFFHDGDCLTTPAPEPECGLIDCPQDVSPFCAIPTGFCGQPQTFNNRCYLEVYNCFNPDEQYKYFHDGECLTTPEPEPNCAAISCSNEGPAICGLPDGVCGPPQTFTNGCNLEVYNCFNPDAKYKYFHDGECIEQPKECPTVCPYNYDPICAAGQSGNVQTFPNECTLESQNCLNENDQYTVVHAGECDECADIKCNKIGQPICASNSEGTQQSFGNPCMLQQHNCENCNDRYEYSYDGSCIEEPKCPTVCPFNYVPICAAGQSGNIQTFSNGCAVASHNCLNENDQYTVIHDGECDECADIKCNKIGQPICATNSQGAQQTFGNPCMLQQHNRDNCHDSNSSIRMMAVALNRSYVRKSMHLFVQSVPHWVPGHSPTNVNEMLT
ncbi:uncharacterized protein LOC119067825 isoform X8 [Bradysia coprophila]|uniref:uncharacterized protein LOC119067825 isoform X8 n=1 Tax=Bradysia coprophila TaxID=38358 RepID=UPI00187D6F62|nr:uncharacterized protein LOC119067825 isoform X8 [Bradysia coprophila]